MSERYLGRIYFSLLIVTPKMLPYHRVEEAPGLLHTKNFRHNVFSHYI